MFIKEIIRSRLDGNPNFEMITNPTGLVFENILGYNILCIHGEVKNMAQALKDFSNTYNTSIDILIGAHKHHLAAETVGIDKDVRNIPSIIGIDDFSISLNKTSRPGASLFVLEERNEIVTEHNIKL